MGRAAQDRYAWAPDGVRLHWREWAGADAPSDGLGRLAPPAPPAGVPLLCIPGLTRNVKDFDALAARLAPRRVVAVSLRGRGESGWAKDPLSYVPFAYLRDLARVIDDAGLERFAVLGSSAGAELAMLLEVSHGDRIAGLALNDWGPDVLAQGLARLRGQVGRGSGWATWLQAARDIAERQAGVYPAWGLDDWLGHAKRLCRVSRAGRIVWDYDPGISEPFRLRLDREATDPWLALDAFRGVPVLCLRGERSDVLAPDGPAAMAARLPAFAVAAVPGVGHPPTLAEPEALAAIAGWLARVDTGQPEGTGGARG